MNQTAPVICPLRPSAEQHAQYSALGGRQLEKWIAELPGGEVLSLGRGIDRPLGCADEVWHVAMAVLLLADQSMRRAASDAERDWVFEFLEMPAGWEERHDDAAPLVRHFCWPRTIEPQRHRDTERSFFRQWIGPWLASLCLYVSVVNLPRFFERIRRCWCCREE